MTPKEKAKDIVDKMWLKQRPCFNSLRNEINLNDTFTNAKECALIAVNEIISNRERIKGIDKLYWQRVKEELNKL